ncbi:MAG: sugar phosphate isomerase/epimerase family protein [Candidatus Latescibacter sp.]|nr:sugar phosphate isomerase/epimerase family protein [Candidatus Latescibacter sp.]
MKNRINRRQALGVGASAAGLMMGTAPAPSEANVMPDVWGEDFLTQWSPPEKVKRDLNPGPSHIRLSCETFRMRKAKGGSYADQVKIIRDAGYTACEAGAAGWDFNISDSEIREMQAALKQYDVEFYGLHVWINIIDPDLQKRANAHKLNCQAIEMADRLGMKFVLTHTGGRSPINKDVPHPLNWTKETWDMSVAAVKQILKDTSGSKVDLGFEAVNSCNNNTPQSHVRLRKDVGDPRVKVTLDPSNMLHPGTFYRTSELLNQCFALLGEDIVYAHAKDQVWRDMLPHIEPITLGKGSMDYELFLAHLSRMKKPRCLLLEHLPQDQYEPSRQFLLDTAKKIGVKIYGA